MIPCIFPLLYTLYIKKFATNSFSSEYMYRDKILPIWT